MIFRRKKKQPVNINLNYTTWEADFGFLTLLLTKEINANRTFIINPMSTQMDGYGTIKDSDVSETIEIVATNVLSSLSNNYKQFLLMKYFRDEEALVSFIVTTVYLEIFKASTEANMSKINNIKAKALSKNILKMNNLSKDIDKNN